MDNLCKVEVAPYWNVNDKCIHMPFIEDIVEVAPYWNVNLTELIFKIKVVLVEVAPYWNVNNHLHILSSHSLW